ncbi:TetR/AcrR family transcriptional regulator [Embleya sp. AB8]|uniref:TetR/AcrR family transcriptional regulator n=1 Tax=Embleya sp. AB8 TaxID=3156304 RepID=UPI003C773508
MAADTRDRVVEATVAALQRHGVAGMSFTDVLRESGAARGAIYHHFPGGKRQLVAEAAGLNGRQVRERLAELPADSPSAVVAAFLAAVRPVVHASTTGGGCAVAAVTVDAGFEPGGQEDLRRAADTAFSAWTEQLAERLATAGLGGDQARDLATTLVMLLEGAHVLCRASGSLDPFERAARTAAGLVRD